MKKVNKEQYYNHINSKETILSIDNEYPYRKIYTTKDDNKVIGISFILKGSNDERRYFIISDDL